MRLIEQQVCIYITRDVFLLNINENKQTNKQTKKKSNRFKARFGILPFRIKCLEEMMIIMVEMTNYFCEMAD